MEYLQRSFRKIDGWEQIGKKALRSARLEVPEVCIRDKDMSVFRNIVLPEKTVASWKRVLHVDVEHIVTGQSFAIPKTSDKSSRGMNTWARGGVDDHCWMVNALSGNGAVWMTKSAQS